jgi:8-oxo-dGTP pyrophosphatase MutT (NUDIX family)
VKNDISTVVKLILIDNKDRVLFIKRSDYVLKFSGEWDLPGGHLKEDEDILSGLNREVFEETNLEFQNPVMIKVIDNLHFFRAGYNSQPVKLSEEHVEYRFFEKQELNRNDKFQNIALEALEELDK